MNHRMATRVVIAGAMLAIAVGISRPAAAHAGGTQRLLERYQPVTVLDATEQFAPTGVASFVSDAALETQTAPGVWSVVDATPSLRPAARRRQPGMHRPGPHPVLPAEPARLHAARRASPAPSATTTPG